MLKELWRGTELGAVAAGEEVGQVAAEDAETQDPEVVLAEGKEETESAAALPQLALRGVEGGSQPAGEEEEVEEVVEEAVEEAVEEVVEEVVEAEVMFFPLVSLSALRLSTRVHGSSLEFGCCCCCSSMLSELGGGTERNAATGDSGRARGEAGGQRGTRTATEAGAGVEEAGREEGTEEEEEERGDDEQETEDAD